MTATVQATPLASFESKWSVVYPELAVGLRFVGQDERHAQGAFACLVHEIEHAAFAVREAEPALTKLQWWAEEFGCLATGAARHPLTQVLALHVDCTALPIALWHEVIMGAIAQRDPEPAADRAALLHGYAALYRPLAAIEAALFPAASAAATAHVRTLARALRETANLSDALLDGRLPLPLDLLAGHRLVRGELARNSPRQMAAIREWLAGLAAEYTLAAVAPPGLGVLAATAASANRWRAHAAARADAPLVALNDTLTRAPLRAVWAAWRAARRLRR